MHITRSSGRRRLLALAGVLACAAAFYAAAVQPRIAQWGSTQAERQRAWPGDALVGDPRHVWTNAITIDRPPAQVWPWLVQWGQGRAGLYSYDWLENAVGCDVHSSDRILKRHQHALRTGDEVIRMCAYAPHNPIALVRPGHALVLGDPADSRSDLLRGASAATWAFIVEPRGPHTTRLIVRSRSSSAMALAQGPLQFVMQRRTMQGIKERAEGSPPSSAANLEPILWLLAAGVFVTAALRALRRRRQWEAPLALGTGALAVLLALMFWQPPLALGAALDVALLGALVGTRRRAPNAARRPRRAPDRPHVTAGAR